MTAEPAHLTPQEVEQPNTTAGVKRGKTDRGNQLLFLRNGKVITGLIVLGFFTLIAIIGPYIAPYDPDALGDDIVAAAFDASTGSAPRASARTSSARCSSAPGR